MINIENISKNFGGVAAVDDVSMEINKGEKIVLLGTSGCGKTTLLKLINRLIEPTRGNIFINGKSILGQKPEILRRDIGYVLQHHGLFPHYTIEENIAIVPKLLKWDEKKIKARTISLLEKLNLNPNKFLKLFPSQLSGGQQQRVGIARALAAGPPVLLMDEPFSALDTITKTAIKKEILSLDEFVDKTIVTVTHDVEEAFEMGDRVCLMDKGKIMQLGKPTDLLFKPKNDFVKLFLKDHLFALELKSVRIWEIFNFLPSSQNIYDESIPMPIEKSIWEAMEMLSLSKNILLAYFDGETKKLNIEEMMNAFSKLKNISNG